MRHVTPALLRPWHPPGLDWQNGPHSDSLAYAGFSGRFSATIVPLFVSRALVESSLPPKLTIVDEGQLPDWLRGRDDHPVLLLIGKQVSLGRRKPHFGMLQTFPMFRPYLETFVAIPFLNPRDSEKPCPCFHFVRVPCATFWPTELGIFQMGWPKIQCPMKMRREGETIHYSIMDEENRHPLLTAETDLADSTDLAAADECLSRMIAMLSQPHVLFVGELMDTYRFDLRFEAANIKAVSVRGTVHPGLIPSLAEPIEFDAAKISDSEFGALFIETTFMNRGLEMAPRPFLHTTREYLRR
jgi:hypothetical protein